MSLNIEATWEKLTLSGIDCKCNYWYKAGKNRIILMLKSASKNDKPDVRELCTLLLQERIKAIQNNAVKLRIPGMKDQMKPTPGMHFHLAPEMLIQVSCSSTMKLPRESITFRAGEICILPRGVPHVETAYGKTRGLHNLVIAYYLRTISFQVNWRKPGGGIRVVAIEHFDAVNVRRTSDYLEEVAEAHHTRYTGRDAIIQGAMLAHLGALLNVLAGHKANRKDEHFKTVQCRHLVGRNLTDPGLNVQRIADWIQCAPDYLSHLFHRETGEQLSGYINRQRVDHARYLLDSSNLNISEIARASGYSDPGYFTRVYKRLTGETPRQYRGRLGEFCLT